jgi:hypothetical protein
VNNESCRLWQTDPADESPEASPARAARDSVPSAVAARGRTFMRRDLGGWQEPRLPDDPAERRKIGIRLLILAALGLIAQIISSIAW